MSVIFMLVVFSTSLCLIESRTSRGNTIAALYFRGVMHRSLYRLRFPCFSKRDMKAFSTSSRNGSFPTALLIPKNIRKHTTAAVLYLFSIYLQEAPVIFPYATTKAKKNQIKLQNNNVDNNKNNIWSSFGSHSIKLVLKRRKRQDNPCSKAVPIFLRPKHCFKSNSTEPTDKTIIKTTTTIKTTTPDILTIIPETTVTTRRTTSTSSTTPRATSKNTTHKRKTTIPPKKHLAMMNTTTSNTKSSSVSFNIPIQQTAATMISSESFTPATTEDVIQNMKLQNQDSSSSYFAEPLNIVFISTVVALTTITSTVGIIYYMHSKVTGARRKRSNSILDRSSSTDNGTSYMDGEGSSSRASPFTTNVLSNAGSDLTLTPIVSEYDQEIPQSQTADHPMAPRGRAAQPSRDTRKTS